MLNKVNRLLAVDVGHLEKWCQADKDELTAKGLDWTVVEDLLIRRGALKEAETNWHRAQFLRRKSENIRVKELPKGYDLRNELIHHFKYRNPNPDLNN